MNKTDIAKKVTALVVGIGVSKVVTNVIKNNTSPEKVPDQVAIAIAGYVLASMAADATKVYTDAKIQSLVEWWTENVTAKF